MKTQSNRKVNTLRYTNNAPSSRRKEIKAADLCNKQVSKSEYHKNQNDLCR